VTARSKAWTVVARSNTGVVGSNLIRCMNVSLRLFYVCAVLCVGSGLATGWWPVQGALSIVYMITKLRKSGQGPKKGLSSRWLMNEHIVCCHADSPASSHSTDCFTLIIRGGYNRSVSGWRTKWIQSHPTSTESVDILTAHIDTLTESAHINRICLHINRLYRHINCTYWHINRICAH
jgi:hypothetical protein